MPKLPSQYGDYQGYKKEYVDAMSILAYCSTANILYFFTAQDEQADRHDLFKAALGDSKDKFATVSEWFGRGVMVSPPAVEG